MEPLAKKPIRTSPYTVYSGVAAQDIEDKSIVLQVICPELMPHTAFGSVAAGITTGTTKLTDRDGNPIASAVTTANHLVATWEGTSNQRYPPMIRAGEPVEIYKVANQDKYYWRTTGRGRDFRKTDRVHVEIGAGDPSKPGSAKDDTNTWSAYLDSDTKKFGLKTSAVNGEVSAFSIEGDAAAGTFHISDNGAEPGNRIFLDTGATSKVPVFQVNLSSGVTVKLEGDDLFIKVPGKMIMDVGDRWVVNSPITVFNLDKAGSVIINAANVAINTAKDFIVSAGNVIGLKAASTKVTGVLITASLRAATAVKAAAGSAYTPITIQRPQDTPVTDSRNVADTDMVGPPYRNP